MQSSKSGKSSKSATYFLLVLFKLIYTKSGLFKENYPDE